MTTSSSNTRGNATLDPTFAGGIVDLQNLMPADIEILNAGPCLVLRDGGILIGAKMTPANDESTYSLLIKLKANGTLDTSFGEGNGYVIETHALLSHPEMIVSMQQLEDDKIVIVSWVSYDKVFEGIPSLARYFPDGRLDTSFNGGRLLITELPNFNLAATATAQAAPSAISATRGAKTAVAHASVLESANGAILLAFEHRDYYSLTNDRSYLIQITAQGQLDREFQQTGYTRVTYAPDVFMQINGCRKLAEGKILVAGRVNNQGALARITASGAIDTTFNSTGFKLVEDGVASELTGLFVTAGEKIRVIGRRQLSGKRSLDRFVRGYNSDATDDPQFETTYRLYNSGFGAVSGAIESTATDNYLWCFSRVSHDSDSVECLISRLLPNGLPDSAFGEDGYSVIPDTFFDKGLAVQHDLKCIVVALQQSGNQPRFNVYRYLV